MKSIISTALCALVMGASAQKSVHVESATQPNSNGYQKNAYSVVIPQSVLKDVEKNWLKLVATDSKGKASIADGIHLQSDAVNKNISTNTFSLYSKLTETSDGVRVTAWLTQNGKPFASAESNDNQGSAMKKFMRDFAVNEYKEIVKAELKEEQKKQEDIEKQLAGSVKSEEKSNSSIQSNDRSSDRSNAAIQDNQSNLAGSSEKIDDQKEMVAYTASDPNASKGAKKTLSEMEGDKKDLEKDNEHQGKKIDDNNKDNRDEERSIVLSQEEQKNLTQKLEKQKLLVKQVEAKLANIK